MPDRLPPIVYQFKVVLRGISPMIWRRFLVHSDSTIADLHYLLQIAFGWSDNKSGCILNASKKVLRHRSKEIWRPNAVKGAYHLPQLAASFLRKHLDECHDD